MKNGLQLDIMIAIEARDAGIQKAIDHAESVNPDWSMLAFEELKRFLAGNPGEFMAEIFRKHCEDKNFPQPPSMRAYGGIIRKAAIAGLIRKVRYDNVSNPKAHACFASVWVANKS